MIYDILVGIASLAAYILLTACCLFSIIWVVLFILITFDPKTDRKSKIKNLLP